MPRKQLSEYRAKHILYAALGHAYGGLPVDVLSVGWSKKLANLDTHTKYVVKVDQATKGRFKKGLVRLDRPATSIERDILELSYKGFTHFLIEPYIAHGTAQEYYFALTRDRNGIAVTTSAHGGIDVESRPEVLLRSIYKTGRSPSNIPLSPKILDTLVQTFQLGYFSFLEINPIILRNDNIYLLDAAVEVDDAAAFFTHDLWSKQDLRRYRAKPLHAEECAVRELNELSQASFNLEVLNPDGEIFLLLSGGGASVVLADEVKNLGFGEKLANYGEYSGGPNRDETKLYTTQILSLLLGSQAKRKVLIIAGGVANFTDVRTTFLGVIDAMREREDAFREQHIEVFVRRGGPHEAEGLAMLRDYLKAARIPGSVHGPELVLTDIISQAIGGQFV